MGEKKVYLVYGAIFCMSFQKCRI